MGLCLSLFFPQFAPHQSRPLGAPAPPRPPPELAEDAVSEILLRIPPEDPAHLVRASLVCKQWRRILTDPAFLRRYRDFQRGAPLLGFFHNPESCGIGFVPASRLPFPYSFPRYDAFRAIDCRHGRRLFQERDSDNSRSFSKNLVVCDPITHECEELPGPSVWCRGSFHAVVLCAVAGCDHRGCRGGPFLVVYVGIDSDHDAVVACVYSSQARAWGTPVFGRYNLLSSFIWELDDMRPALVGDGIYFTLHCGAIILKYDLVKRRFSLIGLPQYGRVLRKRPVLMQNEDGSLGFAIARHLRLYIWSRTANPEGWVQRRVIVLDKLLPMDKEPHMTADVIGFAEGLGIFLLTTDLGSFILELKSGQVMNVDEWGLYLSAFPFIIFFTPDYATSRYQAIAKLRRL